MGLITGVSVTTTTGVAVGVSVAVGVGGTGVLVGIGSGVVDGNGVVAKTADVGARANNIGLLVKVAGMTGEAVGITATAALVGSSRASCWQPTSSSKIAMRYFTENSVPGFAVNFLRKWRIYKG